MTFGELISGEPVPPQNSRMLRRSNKTELGFYLSVMQPFCHH